MGYPMDARMPMICDAGIYVLSCLIYPIEGVKKMQYDTRNALYNGISRCPFISFESELSYTKFNDVNAVFSSLCGVCLLLSFKIY
jgi:hypothetical protein